MACDLIVKLYTRKLPEISHKTVESWNQQESKKLAGSPFFFFWLPLLKSFNQSDFLKSKLSNSPKSIKYWTFHISAYNI